MLRRIALALLVPGGLVLLAAPGACSGFPLPGTSTSPAFIRLVGSRAGVPDTVAGTFTVTVRDLAFDPVANAFVQLDVSACPDIRIASDQLNPTYTVNCTNHTVGAYTNSAGVATLTVLGSSWAAGTYSGLSCGRIYANGELLSAPTVAAFDLDGVGGISAGDLSLWLGDLVSGVYRGRSDYDGNATVSAGDLSIWLAALGRGRSQVTGVACP